jgi:deoxyinosine 3'endonuclease (endonuclease V)
VILVDGNGIWHERSAGLASALGVRLNIPTIGVGKTVYNVGGWHKGLLEPLIPHMLQQAMESLSQQTQRTSCGPTGPQQQQQQQSSGSSSMERFMVWRRNAVDPAMAKSLRHCRPIPQKCELLQRLRLSQTGACGGVAIPLVSQDDNHHHHHPSKRMMCCVLIGHGGRSHRNHETAGTTNPIFVSVGHKVSLRYAVALVCNLSLVRIPEPIRQADLRGREMMRQRRDQRRRADG